MKDVWQKELGRLAQKLYQVDEKELGPILEPTINLKFGDLTSGISFRLAKKARKSPQAVASELKDKLSLPNLDRAEVAGNGYLNLYFSKNFLLDLTTQIQRDQFPKVNMGMGSRVLLEYCSANPTGPLHVGHARQAVVGDALSNILGFAGFNVTREYYINDSGNQAEMLGESIYSRIHDLPLPENGYPGDYVKELAIKLNSSNTKAECRDFGMKELMNEIKHDLSDMGVKFDSYFSQREMEDSKKVNRFLDYIRSRNLCYDKDGAVWFKSTDYGDEKDRPLVKSTGEFAYRLPDVAYHKDKFDRKFDLLVNLVGPDHYAHTKFMELSLRALGFDVSKLKYIIVQHLRVMRGDEEIKMSKRAGNFVMVRDLIDEVGKDATRFYFIMRKAESHMDFDLELAKKQSADNPVYYVQYAHARISSIVRKADNLLNEPDLSMIGEEEKRLIRMLYRFESAIQYAVKDLDQARIATFLTELAGEYQSYYQKGDKDTSYRVLSDDEKLRSMRLYCSLAVQKIIGKGLSILGISAPDRM